ncbi:hypothetical protein ANRL4_02857 [Anaerolineae bacterium]|nr:hypothetical protein ANRL4_02857 [Anaerolineae bacterium]
MARIPIFCVHDEINQWLREICEKHALIRLGYNRPSPVSKVLPPEIEVNITPETERLYLVPANTIPNRDQSSLLFSNIRPREWGWVDITPGKIYIRTQPDGVTETILTLTIIAADKHDLNEMDGVKIVNSIRRYLIKYTQRNIIGESLRSPYQTKDIDHILYSQGAYNLYRSGAIWKQYHDALIQFKPQQSE